MRKVFHKKQKIGEIAAVFPKAMDIFMAYEIDFCCGGNRELEAAIKEQGIQEEELLQKLNAAYEEFEQAISKEKDWTTASMVELIDYIVFKHHTFMKEELPLIDQLLNKILRVHYIDNGELLTKLHKLFNSLKSEIEAHLIKEEEVLFPLIKKYDQNPTAEMLERVLQVMNETENEHEQAGDLLKEMREITGGYKVPDTGCSSFARTYDKLKAIEADLFTHIHLENNILFVRLKAAQTV
ncbi:MAG: iron-sulfur cluster repair di-iron protein [Bacillota bacterium]